MLLPLLRADFALIETYTYIAEEPLDCSISAFGSLQDNKVSYNDLKAWREQTQQAFSLQMFPGDHFYLHSHRSQLLSMISQDLRQLTDCSVSAAKAD